MIDFGLDILTFLSFVAFRKRHNTRHTMAVDYHFVKSDKFLTAS